jgi:hypothetical protein
MTAPTVSLAAAPPPAVARPLRWPYVAAGALALVVVMARKHGVVMWLGGGATLAAFFVGRRLGGVRAGLVAALIPAAAWLAWPLSPVAAATAFLALAGAWWVLRFADDPAAFNGITAGLALGALALVHRFGVTGVLIAVIFLSRRIRPLWMGWPWLVGAWLGWLVARAQPWF